MLVREGWPDSASRDVVMRRFLGRAERADYEGRNPNVQRAWLLGRIAVKDAVRQLLWDQGVGKLFPIEVHVANDGAGRPVVEAPGHDDLRVSIAHTGTLGVAMAADGVDVGIDIEVVEPRPETFVATAFTAAERELLPSADDPARDLEVTRRWCAKEAAAKAAGTGMQGRPQDWEVAAVDGDRLLVQGRWIATTVLGDPTHPTEPVHVVAWTER
jgi:phosphopantetheinyl transferase